MVDDLGKVVDSYLREHSIDKFGLKDVYLGAGISKVKLYDKNSSEPDRFCIVARVQTDQKIPEDMKSKIEKELLKNNPYRYNDEEFPIYVKYVGIAVPY